MVYVCRREISFFSSFESLGTFINRFIFSIFRSYIGDYLRYLQHLGFSRIKIAPNSSSRKKSDNDKNIFFNKAKSRPRRSTGGGVGGGVGNSSGGFVTFEDVEPVYVKKSLPGKINWGRILQKNFMRN